MSAREALSDQFSGRHAECANTHSHWSASHAGLLIASLKVAEVWRGHVSRFNDSGYWKCTMTNPFRYFNSSPEAIRLV